MPLLQPSIDAGRRQRLGGRLLSILLLAAIVGGSSRGASPPAVRSPGGMVAGPERLSSEIGAGVLADGGNAIDAAVAVAFALNVSYPLAGPVGGGGFLLFRDADGEYHALDFRETAPAALSAGHFLDDAGAPIADLSLEGGLSVGVPGGVAGLAEAHRRWGVRSWADLLAPAIALAEDGFPVYPWLRHALAASADRLRAHPETAAIFLPDGHVPAAGDRLRQPRLAATLRRIAAEGPAAFYEGPVARAIVATVGEHGGVMDLGDLAEYRPALRPPLSGRYRGHRVVTFPPPSAGGVALLQILGLLERFDLRSSGPGSSATIHLIVEAERRAFADRARWLGDPDFFDVPVAGLLEPDYLARRAASIRPRRATPSHRIGAGLPATADDGDTAHFSLVDADGRAVALTVTLNRWFGSALVAEGTGVLLNNEIDDFAVGGATPNYYGLTGGVANAVAGGKRPLSSMTPTIVESAESAEPLLVLGSPGGSRIITSVAQVLINVIDHRMELQEAVDRPRFHHQWQPDELLHERRGLAADVRRALERRRHRLREVEEGLGNVNAVGLAGDGSWAGAADPRRQGYAAGAAR